MFDPRQQRPQMQGGGGGGWGQNNPWLQQLAQHMQSRRQQMGGGGGEQQMMGQGQRGPAVGAGMPGPGGVPQPMPMGPGMQPGAAQPAPGGQFGGNPAFLQQLAQRVPQGAPAGGMPMQPGAAPGQMPLRQGFAMPQGGPAPDDNDQNGKRY